MACPSGKMDGGSSEWAVALDSLLKDYPFTVKREMDDHKRYNYYRLAGMSI